MAPEAFGPNLRRLRVQRGVSLEHVATTTKIPADLLAGLERNDFRHWPSGIFARAWVRQYAYAIGADPDSTVDEFCRWFPQGDRRAAESMREQASIIGHESQWRDDLPEGRDRRGTEPADVARQPPPRPAWFHLVTRIRRVLHRA